jgi:hypothetical protein
VTFPLTPFTRSTAHSFSRLQDLTLTLLPHGGQSTARRNAWTAMAADATLARSRREAEQAVAAAAARADQPAVKTS